MKLKQKPPKKRVVRLPEVNPETYDKHIGLLRDDGIVVIKPFYEFLVKKLNKDEVLRSKLIAEYKADSESSQS
jgi:hypothetical protein